MLARGFAFGAENEQFAVIGERIAVAINGILQAFANQIIGIEAKFAALRGVKDEEHVFAIGGADFALEGHAHGIVVVFDFAAGQRIAARIDDAVPFRQLHAGVADIVFTQKGLRERVIEIVARRFAIGLDAQQEKAIDFRPGDFHVAERLGAIGKRFLQQALAAGGVVFDADGKLRFVIADKQGVAHVDVRGRAFADVFAGAALPEEIIGFGQGNIAFAAIVEIAGRALGIKLPAEHAPVAAAFADLEGGKQFAVADSEFGETGLAVVAV